MEGLRSELAQLTSDLERLDLEVRKFTASRQQMDEAITAEQRDGEQKRAAYSVKKRTLDLLPDAEANIGKLQVRQQLNNCILHPLHISGMLQNTHLKVLTFGALDFLEFCKQEIWKYA